MFLIMVDSEIIFIVGISALGVLSIAYVLFGFSISSTSYNKNNINIRGVKNVKNNCFINSILQSLASSKSMVEWLERVSHKIDQSKDANLMLQLSSVVDKINNYKLNSTNDDEVVTPEGVFDSLRKHRWIFSNDEQDAFELFSVLTSTLDKEYNQLSFSLSVLDSLSNQAENFDDDFPSKKSNFVSRVNDNKQGIKKKIKNSLPTRGVLSNHLKCQNCHRNYPIQLDVFDSISLSLPPDANLANSIKLEDCLQKFISNEEIENFKCQYCNTESTFTKRIDLIKLPKLLCFHIQRLVWSVGRQPFKRMDHVKFPKILNMDPFKRKSNAQKPNGFIENCGDNATSQTTKPTIPNNLYVLNSIIVHLGNDNSGHFICYRSVFDKRSKKTKWFYTSDLVVKEVSEKEVFSSCAYMLFYESSHNDHRYPSDLSGLI